MAKQSSHVRKEDDEREAPVLDSDHDALEHASLAKEVQRLLRENEQRNAELAIINSVQQGLASKLDIQAIYELVGDKIREIFHNTDTEIRVYDPKANLFHVPYSIEDGERIAVDSISLSDARMSAHVLHTGQTLVINENFVQELEKYGAKIVLGRRYHPKSAVFVPLLVGSQAYGLIILSNVEREHAFHSSAVRLLQTLANSMSTALENARLFDETKQRAAELAIINSVQEGLASKLDVQAIYDLVGDKIRDIFHAQGTAIYLFDRKTELLDTPYCYLKKRFEIEARPFSEHPIAKLMVDTVRPITYRNVEEYRALGGAVLENSEEYKSGMYVPLMVGKEIRGMVGVANLDKENAYGESDLRLLTTLASSMSTALENARLFDETQSLLRETEQRNAELAIINSVQAGLAEGLASKRDMQAIYDLVGDKIRELFPNTDTEIRIYDAKTNLFHVPYYIENGQRLAVDPVYPSDATMSAHVLRSGQTLVINENIFQEMEKYGAKMMHGRRVPAKSVVFVPLLVGDQARGLIILSNVEREHAFRPSDVRLLQTLANSMSTALDNARLFDEAQRLLGETEQRNAELAIINSVQQGLASKLDMQAIYDLVGDKVQEIFDAQSLMIVTFDHIHQRGHLAYKRERGVRYYTDPYPLTGLHRHIIQSGKTVIINEKAPEWRIKYGMFVMPGTEPAKSMIYVPLHSGTDVSGMITIQNLEREFAFSDTDVRLLETLASSMSVALENARLFDETQRLLKETEQRAAELAIINTVQEGLAAGMTSNEGMQAIYDLVADKMRDLFNAESGWILTFDLTTRTRRVECGFYKGQRFYYPDPLPFNKLTEHLIATKKPLVINRDAEARSAEFEMVLFPGVEQFKSAVFVPLMTGSEMKGWITVQNGERENAFSEADVNLLSTFASSISVALENTRLFDEVQKKNAEITESLERETASNDILRVIAASPTNIQPVLDVIARNAAQLSGSDDAIITLREDDILRVDAHYGDIPTFSVGEGMRFNRDSVAGRAILEGRPVQAIHNRHGVKSEYPEGDKAARKYGYRMTCAVPLLREGKAIGAISIRRIKPELLTEKQIALIQSFANQAAIAVENVRLFNETTRLLKETEQRAAELGIINSVQEGLVSKLDIQAIYDLVGDKIRDLFRAQSVWILTFDRVTRTRQVKYSFETGQRFYTSELLPFNRLTEHLIATKKTLVINRDANARIVEFEMASVAGTERFKSAIFVPLITDSEVKGMISLQNIEEENAFSESDISLLSTLASSMSVALENARLFDESQRLLQETEQRAAELAIINSVQQALSSKLEMQAIYELVGDQMQEIFDAQSLLIVTFDHSHEMAQVTYNREKGIRHYSEPYPFTGLNRYLIQSGRTLVINENLGEWRARLEMIVLPGTEIPRSMVFVPLNSGKGVSGFISLQNLEREHAFSEMDVRLLETLASSMSAALENASLFDETQRLFLEAKEARLAAEQANQAKSAFLSSMSHELRTPLNAIINFVEMIARGMIGPVNQEQVELLDQALHSSKHLLNLINDVLDISKIQAGQLTLFIEEQVSVQVEVEAALSITGGLLQEKGLQLIRDVDAHLPLISCDRRRVRQVLLNLISNAIKFTNEGTVTVSVKNQGQELLFAVIDTGAGIPPDKQALIFEPFLQAENGERQVHGTGLGLPISRSLVRAHGGELWVESQPGEGSAFYFTLPVERRSVS